LPIQRARWGAGRLFAVVGKKGENQKENKA